MTQSHSSRTVAPFHELDGSTLTSGTLREQLEHSGYALIRGLLSPSDLRPLLQSITAILHEAGWLADNSPERLAVTASACSGDDPEYKRVYDSVFALELFHALPHHPALARMMKYLTGPELLVHPKSAARLIFPHCEGGVIHAHQDHTAVGGDSESYTAWMPLHDCPAEQGSLRILAGSHRYGLQATAAQTGYIPGGTARGREWVGGEIRAGDVLLFHSLTVHEAVPNQSDRLRLSVDCRFQSYLRSVNPGTLVFSGSGRRSWEQVYSGWASQDLQYYWTRLPLRFKPTCEELAKLAETGESPGMRERYARILERVREQDFLAA